MSLLPSAFWLVLLAANVACGADGARQRTDSTHTNGSPVSVGSSMRPQADSSGDNGALVPGSGLPHVGAWRPTTTYEGDRFSIDYPKSADSRRAKSPAESTELIISELPECKWPCYVTVTLWRDSTCLGLNGLLHELTTPDSSSGNADADDYVASIVDSLPLGHDRAVHVELYCGDCTRHGLLTASDGWLAEIEYSLDDRDGNSSALLARLQEIARSFHWKRS